MRYNLETIETPRPSTICYCTSVSKVEKMEIQLKYQTLIELFNQSLARSEFAEKNYLEIVRTERRENLTFGELRAKAQEFAVHLIQNRNIRIGDKAAILIKYW